MQDISVQHLYDRYDKILSGELTSAPLLTDNDYQTYAITNFRGGIGKTTLSFNLAYAMCQKYFTLFLDMCPQTNFSSLLLNQQSVLNEKNIYEELMHIMMGAAWSSPKEGDIALRVQDYNAEFHSGKTSYVIPGSSKLFLFPSQFYSRLNEYLGMTSGSSGEKPIAVILNMLRTIIREQMKVTKTDKALIDTSPFFAGGTHLAWMAADALIIPVRVDEQSIYSLELTLEMLENEHSDFNIWRTRAGVAHKPTVQAILMTHCGWNRQADHQIDRASRMYIERAVQIAHKYSSVFSSENVADHFAFLSDFQSAGRISGSKAIPIEKLISGRQHNVEGRKLEVNVSVERYKKELQYAFDLVK